MNMKKLCFLIRERIDQVFPWFTSIEISEIEWNEIERKRVRFDNISFKIRLPKFRKRCINIKRYIINVTINKILQFFTKPMRKKGQRIHESQKFLDVLVHSLEYSYNFFMDIKDKIEKEKKNKNKDEKEIKNYGMYS